MNGFDNVELVKFPEIDEVDSALLAKSFESFFKKNPDVKLHISYKGYSKGGLRTQHEMHAKATLSGKSFFAEVVSWKLLDGVQDCLKKIQRELEKEFSRK
jgi:ribosome-associated translation inhibitor RaiA